MNGIPVLHLPVGNGGNGAGMTCELPMVIFIHVPKTAGMSFRHWLSAYFDGNVLLHGRSRLKPAAQVPGISDRGFTDSRATVCDVSQYLQTHRLNGVEKFSAIGGHITVDFPIVRRLRRPKLVLAAVRDPVERAISRYVWVQANKRNHYDLVRNRTLYQSLKVKGLFVASIRNRQLDFIFGKKRDCPDWKVVVKHDRIDLLRERVQAIFGKREIAFPHRNRINQALKDDVASQPDFDDAVSLLRDLNAEEIEFVNSFDAEVELNRPADAALPRQQVSA
ncbi:MAG: hypothetical protein AB7L41_05795 [Flavobacteriaceae bacterium]